MKCLRNLGILLLTLFLLATVGCRAKSKTGGSWAYSHDPNTPVLILKSNGHAELDGESYSYSDDGTFLILKGSGDKDLKLRYVLEEDGMLLYRTTDYRYAGNGIPRNLLGLWYCSEKKWSFEFTEKGTFLEDGYFPGYYSVDENNSSITLDYMDEFRDTVCYYSLDGSVLSVEYPWKMVRAE